ncbi:hypothetical protein WJX72_010177 [[Myrmecia] bisecta]|uniref:Uncharacterized protein n=1 Tax=[Myrmecia] bisecta TaxID=41462 RepID=A0AAW1R951_9CHLO
MAEADYCNAMGRGMEPGGQEAASDEEPEWSYESFQIPGGMELRLRTFGFHPRNANFVWPGNAQLMEWLDTNQHLLAGKRILELGSATGLLAIFMTMRGWQVTTSDSEADGSLVAANIAHNFQLNSIAAAPHIQHDWGTAFPAAASPTSAFDVIVANDILIYVNTTGSSAGYPGANRGVA